MPVYDEMQCITVYDYFYVRSIPCVGLPLARSPVFSGSSRISAPISRLLDSSHYLPYLTRRSLASEINVLESIDVLFAANSAFNNFCYIIMKIHTTVL